jgi:hypothetical protein
MAPTVETAECNQQNMPRIVGVLFRKVAFCKKKDGRKETSAQTGYGSGAQLAAPASRTVLLY